MKSYGARLVRDHERADREVMALAQRLNIQLVPPQPNSPDEADRLNGMSGSEFDSTFLKAMVHGHQDAMAMLTDAEGQLSSPVKDLVTNLIPTAARDDGSGLTEVNYINELGFGHARIAQSSAATTLM